MAETCKLNPHSINITSIFLLVTITPSRLTWRSAGRRSSSMVRAVTVHVIWVKATSSSAGHDLMMPISTLHSTQRNNHAPVQVTWWTLLLWTKHSGLRQAWCTDAHVQTFSVRTCVHDDCWVNVYKNYVKDDTVFHLLTTEYCYKRWLDIRVGLQSIVCGQVSWTHQINCMEWDGDTYSTLLSKFSPPIVFV